MPSLNVLVSAGFAILGVVQPALIEEEGASTRGVHVLAMYVAARVLPMALAVLAAVVMRARSALIFLTLLASAFQACDVVVGIVFGEPLKIFGPAFLTVTSLVAAGWLMFKAPRETRPAQLS
jgi:hypothetical protein